MYSPNVGTVLFWLGYARQKFRRQEPSPFGFPERPDVGTYLLWLGYARQKLRCQEPSPFGFPERPDVGTYMPMATGDACATGLTPFM